MEISNENQAFREESQGNKLVYQHNCAFCDKSYTGRRNKKFCSDACRSNAHQLKNAEHYQSKKDLQARVAAQEKELAEYKNAYLQLRQAKEWQAESFAVERERYLQQIQLGKDLCEELLEWHNKPLNTLTKPVEIRVAAFMKGLKEERKLLE